MYENVSTEDPTVYNYVWEKSEKEIDGRFTGSDFTHISGTTGYLTINKNSSQSSSIKVESFSNQNEFVDPKREKYSVKENSLTISFSENNSTTPPSKNDINLDNKISTLFEIAHDLEFEDGVETEYSKKINSYIMEYGNSFIKKLVPIFLNEKTNFEILSEALRWIGRIDSPETYEKRLWLLELCLFSSSPTIRDGATLGLASMNDPSASFFLRKAIQKESIKELLSDMKDVLLDLENTINATGSKTNQKKQMASGRMAI